MVYRQMPTRGKCCQESDSFHQHLELWCQSCLENTVNAIIQLNLLSSYYAFVIFLVIPFLENAFAWKRRVLSFMIVSQSNQGWVLSSKMPLVVNPKWTMVQFRSDLFLQTS